MHENVTPPEPKQWQTWSPITSVACPNPPSAETISSWIVCMKEAMNTMISFNGGLMRIRASAVMDFGKCISAIADAAASDGIPSVEAVTKCYTKYAGPYVHDCWRGFCCAVVL
jgi:hypothetical protein